MSTLTKQIKIAHLAEQLDPAEFNQFLSILIKRYGKTIILTALFAHFRNSTSITSQNQIDEIINTMSNILQSRKQQKNNNQIEPQKMCITNLNGTMIGNIASYLNQRDYAHFAKANRAIMIGCNSPNTLQRIDLRSLNTYSSINLQHFRLIKSLEITSEKFTQLKIGNNTHFIPNNVQHLRLNGLFESSEQLQSFMAHSFDGIKKFDFIVPGRNINPLRLWEFFGSFKMIQHLELMDVFVMPLDSDINISNLFPNLRGFTCLNGSFLSNKIINTYSSSLEALKFKDDSQIIIESNRKFDKLRELTVIDVKTNSIDNILKTAKQLNQISISSAMNKMYFKNVIKNMISDKSLLKYMDIKTNDVKFGFIFDGIEKGLFETKKRKRRYFKAKVMINCANHIDINDVMINISRIKNVLQSSNVTHFMLLSVLSGNKKPKKDIMDKAVNDFRDCEQSKAVVHTFCDEQNNHIIVITNNNCKINGYSESWL